ncbi:MAG TPA: hypothetical protein VF789_23815 [Thermoanaerobaculia bacterium]
MPRNEEISRRTESSLQHGQGSLRGDVKTFPYIDLIREHLAQGRILDAKNLLEFARDVIPPDSKLLKVLAPPRIKKSDQLGVDRSNEFRWLRENNARYQGQWVALTDDGLFASAATLADLLVELRASPPPVEPLIHHLI